MSLSNRIKSLCLRDVRLYPGAEHNTRRLLWNIAEILETNLSKEYSRKVKNSVHRGVYVPVYITIFDEVRIKLWGL